MTTQAADISSFLAIKGPLIEETYRAFRDWNLDRSPSWNEEHIAETNSIGATSIAWLQNVLRVIKQRYDVAGPDRDLVELARLGWSIEEWQPAMLWHISRTDELLRGFLCDWLFNRRDQGIVLISAEAVREYLSGVIYERLGSANAWKENTLARVANGLLKAATDFHLMRGRTARQFENYRLPESSFLYLLYALMDREQNTRNVVHAADWRLFLMHPQDVEEELLRLHQYGRLRFERAGSFLELTLPCTDTEDFIRSRTR